MSPNNALNLNYLFKQLFSAKNPPLIMTDLSAANRIEKLRTFLPSSFIKNLEQKKSTSYQSWLLNDDRHHANALFRSYHELLQNHSNELLHEVYQMMELHFDRDSSECIEALQQVLTQFLQRIEFIQNKIYSNSFELYIQMNPVYALSKLILLLCLGDHVAEDLELLFPASELNALRHSSDFPNTYFSVSDEENQYNIALFYYKNGEHTEAFRLFQELSQKHNHPEARYRMGKMLLLADGCPDEPNRESLAFDCFRKNKEHPDSIYELYLCYLKGIGTNKIYRRAKECLEKASRMGVLAANRDLGIAYDEGHEQMQFHQDKRKAYKLFLKGACTDNPEKGDATCQYMLGLYEERKKGYPDETAQNWYRQAAKKGHVRSKQRLLDLSASDKLRAGSDFYKDLVNSNLESNPECASRKLLCFFNSDSTETLDFIRSLPADAECELVFVPPIADYEKLPYIKQITENLIREENPLLASPLSRETIYYTGGITNALCSYLSLNTMDSLISSHTQVIFYLFHPDQKQNLSDGLSLLEALKPLQKHDVNIAAYLARCVDVYLLSEFENTECIIDSAISSMENTYIRVQICNPGIDASRQLLYKRPLFLPCIGENGAEDINLIVIGDNKCIPRLVQNALAVFYSDPKRKFRITVFSKETETIEGRYGKIAENTKTNVELQIKHLCPGIFKHKELVNTEISFFSFVHIDELWELLSYNYLSLLETEKKAAELLCQGNYFVVAFENDLYSIDIATQLRANLLKYDPTFTRTPFIAAYCRDDVLACQTRKFVVGNMAYGFEWFNNYDIYCFGSHRELYSYSALKNDLIRYRGLQFHLSYCEVLNDPIAVSNAYQAYYSRSYNRDTSETGALNLTYRIFAAGITLPDAANYGIPEEEVKLAALYDAWLEDPNHLETAAKLEHHRWNQFMLSRGFEPASLTQMTTYLHKGTPTHLLHIAKLHPFICDWEDLIDEQEGVQFHLNQIMKTLRPDMEPMNIEKVDTKFVLETTNMLRCLQVSP